MKKFISGLLVGVLLMGTVVFAAPTLTYVKSVFTTTVNGKSVKQNVVTIGGVYYADVKQLTSNLGIKYAVDAKTKKITLGESAKKAETITFSNILTNSDYGFTTVTGEAKNNDTKEHSLSIKVTFYDANKKLIGTAIGFLNDVAPGETKTFDAMGEGDFSDAASYKIQVDTLM